jgi:hypothetical protein
VKFIATAQQLSGAWDYRDAKTGRYDTSVTGWQVMALKSAQGAGVDVPHYTVYKMAAFLDRVTQPTGELIYSNKAPSPGRRGWGMVAVGLASRTFLGLPLDAPTARRQKAIILSHLPAWKKLSPRGNETPFDSIYYWYYGTIAMFQVGGDAWDKWNRQMQKTLLLHQRRGGCLDGSWDPPDNWWAGMGGRIYSTSLNVLNLEIYYRYLPVFKDAGLHTVDALVATVKTGGRADAMQAVRLLGRFGGGDAREFLVQLAHGDDPGLAMEASVAMAENNDAGAIEPLLKQLRSGNQFARYRALRALRPMIDRGLAPVFIQALNDEKPTVAGAAAEALRQHARVSFGFEPEAGPRERKEAIEKWRAWWKNRGRGAGEAEPGAPWLVVRVLPEKRLVAFHTARKGQAEEGRKYTVYRSDRYVGRVRVVKVDGEIGLGRIIRSAEADEIQTGDVVKPAD